MMKAVCIAVAALIAVAAAIPADAQSTREALEQQLKEQQAKNDTLRQRIDKLEAMLKTDICTNPEAAEALLKESQAPSPAPR